MSELEMPTSPRSSRSHVAHTPLDSRGITGHTDRPLPTEGTGWAVDAATWVADWIAADAAPARAGLLHRLDRLVAASGPLQALVDDDGRIHVGPLPPLERWPGGPLYRGCEPGAERSSRWTTNPEAAATDAYALPRGRVVALDARVWRRQRVLAVVVRRLRGGHQRDEVILDDLPVRAWSEVTTKPWGVDAHDG